MRASCTRNDWLRSACATSASSPGRSVQTRLSSVRPSPVGRTSKPICGAMRKWRRWRGCDRRAGLTASSEPASVAARRRSTSSGSGALRASAGITSKLSNTMPCGPSSTRACWIAKPQRSSVATIAANRPSRSGECTNTSSAPACAATGRARTQGSPAAIPRSDTACQAIWSGRPRWKPISGMRANRPSISASPIPNAASIARAASRVSALRSSAARGCSSPRRSARRVAVYRSASSRSFHAFQSFGEVPAMSAQVSRYR